MIGRLISNYLYFCRRMVMTKWSLWTWPLGIGWFAYEVAYIFPKGREDVLSIGLLTAANIALWSDVYRDIKRRGYKLQRFDR